MLATFFFCFFLLSRPLSWWQMIFCRKRKYLFQWSSYQRKTKGDFCNVSSGGRSTAVRCRRSQMDTTWFWTSFKTVLTKWTVLPQLYSGLRLRNTRAGNPVVLFRSQQRNRLQWGLTETITCRNHLIPVSFSVWPVWTLLRVKALRAWLLLCVRKRGVPVAFYDLFHCKVFIKRLLLRTILWKDRGSKNVH